MKCRITKKIVQALCICMTFGIAFSISCSDSSGSDADYYDKLANITHREERMEYRNARIAKSDIMIKDGWNLSFKRDSTITAGIEGPYWMRALETNNAWKRLLDYQERSQYGYIIAKPQTQNNSSLHDLGIRHYYKDRARTQHVWDIRLEPVTSNPYNPTVGNEVLAGLVLQRGYIYNKYGYPIGICGRINLDNRRYNVFRQCNFSSVADPSQVFNDPNNPPVVITTIVTDNNSGVALHARVKDVSNTGFKYNMEGWSGNNIYSKRETMYWVAFARGVHDMGTDNYKTNYTSYKLEVGTVAKKLSYLGENNGNYEQRLQTDFTGGDPLVLAEIQTCNDPNPAICTVRNITSEMTYLQGSVGGVSRKHYDNFQVRVRSNTTSHTTSEEIGYIALGPQNGGRHPKGVDYYGNLYLDGNGKLRGTNKPNQIAMLRGMSLFWPNWNQGRTYANASVIDWLVDDWKCNVIRIPLPVDPRNLWGLRSDRSGYWMDIEMTNGRFDPLESPYIDLMCDLIEACIHKGIYVIVDWHVYDAVTTNGANRVQMARDFFNYIASKYGDEPNIIYEIWNEPTLPSNQMFTYDSAGNKWDESVWNDYIPKNSNAPESDYNPSIWYRWKNDGKRQNGTDYNQHEVAVVNNAYKYCEYRDIVGYANDVISYIRYAEYWREQDNSKPHHKNVIIVGSPRFSGDIHMANVNDLSQKENVMAAFHFYAGTHRPKGLTTKDGGSYPKMTYAKEGFYDGQWQNLTGEDLDDPLLDKPGETKHSNALDQKIPVFATEWGTTTADGGQENGVWWIEPQDLTNLVNNCSFAENARNGCYFIAWENFIEQFCIPYYLQTTLTTDDDMWDNWNGTTVYKDSSQLWLDCLETNGISWCNWAIGAAERTVKEDGTIEYGHGEKAIALIPGAWPFGGWGLRGGPVAYANNQLSDSGRWIRGKIRDLNQ